MRTLIIVVATVLATACDGSRADTMKRLAETQEISAQKDSLLRDVNATTAFLADLNRQVSTVRNLKAGLAASGRGGDLEENLTPAQRREVLQDQVREITERVNLAENRLAVSRRRVTELTGADAAKSKRLAEFDSTIASFREIMENQRVQIASLSEQVEALTAENTQLKTDNLQLVAQTTALSGQRDSLRTDRNTVYYVVSTKKDLMKRRVIEEVGGFLGLGSTAVAARDLDRNQFIAIDKSAVSDIPLPRADKSYRILTRHDLAALDLPASDRGQLTGSMRIKDPEAFWAASKFLIVVER